jgi:hypothetical protein
MRLSAVTCIAISLAAVEAAILPSVQDFAGQSLAKKSSKNCLPVWNTVSTELAQLFTAGSAPQCNDLARAAIRLVFHDCGTWDTTQGLRGGCDGSLVLTDELGRAENRGLQTVAAKVVELAGKYGVSAADMTVFAGSKFRCTFN